MSNYVGQNKNHLYLTRICTDVIHGSSNKYMAKSAIFEKIFTSFEEAKSHLVNLMDEFDVLDGAVSAGSVISEIQDFLIGEPIDEYDLVLKDHFPITMDIETDGSIVEFHSNSGLDWTVNDLMGSDYKYDLGDIVDRYVRGEYLGTYVILRKPISLLDSILSGDNDNYVGGYRLCGHNVLSDYTGEEDVDWIYDTDDIRPSKYYTMNESIFNTLQLFAEHLGIVRRDNSTPITDIERIRDAYLTGESELNSINRMLQLYIYERR